MQIILCGMKREVPPAASPTKKPSNSARRRGGSGQANHWTWRMPLRRSQREWSDSTSGSLKTGFPKNHAVVHHQCPHTLASLAVFCSNPRCPREMRAFQGNSPRKVIPEVRPPKKQTLASRVFHSVRRSCLAFLVVAVPTCQYTVKFVTLGQPHPKRESHIMLSQEIFKHRLFVHQSSSQNMASSAHVPTLP